LYSLFQVRCRAFVSCVRAIVLNALVRFRRVLFGAPIQMFLSKDFFGTGEVQSTTTPTFWSHGFSQSSSSTSPPCSRPTSSSGRPGLALTAGLDIAVGDTGDTSDEQVTPTSASALRQKMMLQRQRTLQRSQRQGGMVMANQSMPHTEVPPVAGSSGNVPVSRPSTASSSSSCPAPQSSMLLGNSRNMSSSMDTLLGPMGIPRLDSTMSSMMPINEQDGIVMPDPGDGDEARRRNSLAQHLDERGISPVFDPMPSPSPGRGTHFDIRNITSLEMKPFLLAPSPKHAAMIECRIIRERNGLNKLFPKYTMESDSGVFLMTAKKQKHNKTSNYAISMSRTEISKDDDTFLGKLRSNFLGLEFTAYGRGTNPKKIDSSVSEVHAMQLARQELVAVTYSSSLWGSKPRGPRKMSVVIPRVQPTGERLMRRTLHPEKDGLLALQKAGSETQLYDSYKNKPPEWKKELGAFVLNFNKRVTQASVKNFQLTGMEDLDTVYLQFGRVGKDVFNIDFRYPFSPFQAFAICLSSFDYKLCCE